MKYQNDKFFYYEYIAISGNRAGFVQSDTFDLCSGACIIASEIAHKSDWNVKIAKFPGNFHGIVNRVNLILNSDC